MTCAIHSFDLPISTDFLAIPISPLPVIYVAYKLDYSGKITDIHYKFPEDVPENIKDWVRFRAEARGACESNALGHRRPGDWMSKAVPDTINLSEYEKSFYATNDY